MNQITSERKEEDDMLFVDNNRSAHEHNHLEIMSDIVYSWMKN
jgi:hypothetical protein